MKLEELKRVVKWLDMFIDREDRINIIMQGVKFENKNVAGTNGRTSVVIPFDSEIKNSIIDFKALYETANKINSKEDVSVLDDTASVCFISGKRKITVTKVGTISDWIKPKEVNLNLAVTLTRNDISAIYSLPLFTESNIYYSESLKNIYFDGKHVAGFNTHSGAEYTIENPKITEPVILPVRLIGELNIFNADTYEFKKSTIIIRLENKIIAYVRFNPVQDKYPNYKNIIPEKTGLSFAVFNSSEMMEILKASIIGIDESNYGAGSFLFEGNKIKIETKSKQSENGFNDFVPANLSGFTEDFKISLKINQFIEILKFLNSEEIRIYVQAKNKAVLFDGLNNRKTCIVMPVAYSDAIY